MTAGGAPPIGRPWRQLVAGLAIAIGGGLVVGWVDSRPGWDATGIIVVSLVAVAMVGAAVARRVPWLVALLVGGWVPLFEMRGLAGGGPLAAIAFAAVGAAIGWVAARWSGRRSPEAPSA